jgi:hypothetical protein
MLQALKPPRWEQAEGHGDERGEDRCDAGARRGPGRGRRRRLRQATGEVARRGGRQAPTPVKATSKDPKVAARKEGVVHGVRWGLSYEAALARAAAEGRPVLVHFAGVHGADSRVMERTILPRREVAERLARFVTVRLDVDTSRSALSRGTSGRHWPRRTSRASGNWPGRSPRRASSRSTRGARCSPCSVAPLGRRRSPGSSTGRSPRPGDARQAAGDEGLGPRAGSAAMAKRSRSGATLRGAVRSG